jgi:hypothetical protein
MERPSREERYLHILTSGQISEDDYEHAKYLIDKKYLDGAYQLSNMRDSYGKVRSVVSSGPTSNGIDFIDELRTRANNNEIKILSNNEPNDIGNEKSQSMFKVWRDTLAGKIAVGVFIPVLAVMVIYLLRTHLGIQL